MGGKTPEDHRMNRADARACQHRDDRLGHHGHVDNDPIAFLNSLPGEHAGKSCYLIEQFAIGERLDDSGHRTIVNERRLIRPPVFDVAIERIVASIEQSAGEPSIERRPRVIEHPVPFFIPMNRFGRLGPEILGIVQPASIDGVIGISHGVPSTLLDAVSFLQRSICDRAYSGGGFAASRSVTVYTVAGKRRRDRATNGHPQECRKAMHHGLRGGTAVRLAFPPATRPKMIDTSRRGDTIRRCELKNIEGGESWLKVCH